MKKMSYLDDILNQPGDLRKMLHGAGILLNRHGFP